MDDIWTTDHEAHQEDDGHYNVNNVLLPEQIKKTSVPLANDVKGTGASTGFSSAELGTGAFGAAAVAGGAGAAMLSGVTPQSTTANLAGSVPNQATASTLTAGDMVKDGANLGFGSKKIASPAAEAEDDGDKLGGDDFSGDKRATTAPGPYETVASKLAPGGFPETPAAEEESTFGVKPIPASEGIGNPISVPAGEKLPDQSAINSNTVDSTATTSKEGYEKDASAAFPAAAAAAGMGGAAAAGIGMYEHEKKPEEEAFGVKPIPASSGIGNPISVPAGEKLPEQSSFNSTTVESTATTSKEGYERDASAPLVASGAAGLAESKDTSAFSIPEKSNNMIPESSLPMGDSTKDTMDAGPTISSAAPKSSSYYLAATQPVEPRREAVVMDEETPSATLSSPAPAIPEMVKESMAEAHESPEAAASAEAVEEKAAMESELLTEVKSTDATGEPAPSAATGVTGVGSVPASSVPEPVKDSMLKANESPEAAVSAEAVQEKSAVESELLKEVKSTDATGEPAPTATAAPAETAPAPTSESGLGPAAVSAAAVGEAAPPALTQAKHAAPFTPATPGVEVMNPVPDAPHSRPATSAKPELAPPVEKAEESDLRPMSKDPHAAPAHDANTGATPTKKTLGPAAAGTTPTSATTSSPASTATKEQKTKNRRSFFGKLKDKLKDL